VTGITVQPRPNGFGAHILGVDLTLPLTPEIVLNLREIWLNHQVISFTDQPLDHAALERFTGYFGGYGNDPYVQSIEGHDHILEVRREPDEAIAPFGAAWHSDWSFQQTPPSATILHAKIVPPIGGETLYADGVRAFETLETSLRDDVESLTAIHSARRPYSREGYEKSGGPDRSMTILPSDKAWETQEHPVVRTHPESGRKVLWVNPVYTIGIKGLSVADSEDLLGKLCAHALQEEFVYTHTWRQNMLTMWDNRSVQHCAQGGYDGHRRVLHRTTVAGDQPF
jgi:taurine dioxygenase